MEEVQLYHVSFHPGTPLEGCRLDVWAPDKKVVHKAVMDAGQPQCGYRIHGPFQQPEMEELYLLQTVRASYTDTVPGGRWHFHTQHHLLALSYRQPWADLIMLGYKTIETRKWKTDFRGDILVCSSSISDTTRTIHHWTGIQHRYREAGLQQELRGHALGIIKLDSIETMTAEHEKAACIEVYPRAQSWHVSNVRHIEPFPIKGRLGLWAPYLNYQLVFKNKISQ